MVQLYRSMVAKANKVGVEKQFVFLEGTEKVNLNKKTYLIFAIYSIQNGTLYCKIHATPAEKRAKRDTARSEAKEEACGSSAGKSV